MRDGFKECERDSERELISERDNGNAQQADRTLAAICVVGDRCKTVKRQSRGNNHEDRDKGSATELQWVWAVRFLIPASCFNTNFC